MMVFISDTAGGGPPSDGRSDAQLLTSIRVGDPDAYVTLWRRHRTAALRAALALTGRPEDAEALAHEAFELVTRAVTDASRPIQFFRALLFTTMRHRIRGG